MIQNSIQVEEDFMKYLNDLDSIQFNSHVKEDFMKYLWLNDSDLINSIQVKKDFIKYKLQRR
jgi:hypothetical protein